MIDKIAVLMMFAVVVFAFLWLVDKGTDIIVKILVKIVRALVYCWHCKGEGEVDFYPERVKERCEHCGGGGSSWIFRKLFLYKKDTHLMEKGER